MPLRVKTLRPAVLPDNRKTVPYPVVVAGIVVVLPLIILAVFPRLPILFHVVYWGFVKVEVATAESSSRTVWETRSYTRRGAPRPISM